MSKPSRKVRDTVIQRDRDRCVRCGRYVPGYPGSIHHRTPRMMGGTRDPRVNRPSNLVLLCGTGTTGCHGWVESHRDEAKDAGLLIPWWQTPSEVPIRYRDRNVFLDDDGGVTDATVTQ